jgi:hypothetical protein
VTVAVVLAAVTTGCVTGHLFEAARRWERVRVFEQASLDGDRLVVRYLAQVTDDAGTLLDERRRRAVVALGPLRGSQVSVEDVLVVQVRDVGALPGRGVSIVTIPPPDGGGPASLVVHDERGTFAPIPANAFTTTSTAGWVYPLAPLALGVDATSLPVLLFFAPAPMVIGD